MLLLKNDEETPTQNKTTVLFVIDNAMTQMQEQRIKNIAVYNRYRSKKQLAAFVL